MSGGCKCRFLPAGGGKLTAGFEAISRLGKRGEREELERKKKRK